jgi:hypothetical protein
MTVIVNEHAFVLPAASVARQTTVVTPTGKFEPEGGTQVEVTPGQLSETLGENPTVAEFCPNGADTTVLAGQVIVGRSVSLIVTVNVQLLLLPLASRAVEVTVVMPFGKVEPEGGSNVTATLVEQASVATAVKVMFEAEHCPGSVERTMFAGQVSAGGV